MSYFTPEDAPDKKYYIFGQGASDQLANELSIKVLGRIPIEAKLSETGDKGTPLSLVDGSAVTEAFAGIAQKLKTEVAKL
jgi:ATP-binding protein involved in chromosome partitioning